MALPKLNRETILVTALELADSGGLERVTARELATRLGVTPMALYRHVGSIGSVIDGLLERVIGGASIVDHASPELDAWLVETFRRIHSCLVDHPSVLPLLGTSSGYGREALHVVDAILGRLSASGYEPAESFALFHSLLAYTLGAASIEAAAASNASKRAQRGSPRSFEAERLEGLPNVRYALPLLVRFTETSTFVDSLGRLVRANLLSPSILAPLSLGSTHSPGSTQATEVG